MLRWLPLLLFMALLLTIVVLQPTSSPRPVLLVRGNVNYWHLVKDGNDIWWLTSPKGEHHFMNTVTTIVPTQDSASGPAYRSNDYNGDLDAWAKATSDRVLGAGFRGSGAWSSQSIAPYMPYARDLNLIKWTKRDIDDPRWESDIEAAVARQVTPLREDKNLVGYYLDNELHWTWDGKLAENADKYFEVTTRLVRKYDPNHLILGVRFNVRPPLSVLKASKGRVDVQSVNVYTDTGKLWKNSLRDIYVVTNSPIIISEYSFWAVENNSGNTSSRAWWAGQQTQEQRAAMYRKFVLGTAQCSFIVGMDWFQWNDEPPAGRADGEDLNCGIVDIHDHPYPEMVEATKYVAARVDQIHASGDDRQATPIWLIDPVRNK